ncbi:MAG: 30S ribosomal protein S12 methylthiotransferase RimO [Gammaproteobacteria bacterium]|nr:30S ribosomal protein S12 methylthiotransferase RimO [Gammaproteobacteria bacterium]
MPSSMPAPKIGFISLGCPKALVDSERILTQLRVEGYEIVPSYDDADMVVVNTCGFIDAAKQESLDTIGEALAENGKVIVTGCMGANEQDITDVHPKVLDVSGPHAYEQVVGAVKQHLPYRKPHNPHIDLVPPQGIKLTPRHFAYLKISEGCNHRCTFCIIPSMRGDLVSRPANDVVAEAEGLVRSGVKELLVISQDTSAYGVDTKYRTTFHQGQPVKTKMLDLCRALGELGGDSAPWVRLHYVYPYPHVDDIIPLMAEGKILPYLDIPFQHGSPKILKAMKRPGAIDNTLARIHRWREQCPDLTIRSTFIVGFPGETESDFQQLLDFLEAAQLDRVGAFAYSPVEGAAANALPDPVEEDIKQQRLERFMRTQAKISSARLRQKVGRTMQIIIDEVDAEGAIGRSKADAPEIDGVVYLNGETDHQPGDFVEVTISASDEHDLWGTSTGAS